MLLRESGEKEGVDYDLSIAAGAEIEHGTKVSNEFGIEFESELISIAEAVCRGIPSELEKVRGAYEPILGAQKLVDVISIAASFNGITKIANATGLQLDPHTESATVEMRALTGIDEFSETSKTARFDG